MPDQFYGAEITETGPGAGVVREGTAATVFLTGTAPVDTVHTDPVERAKYINKSHIIRSREEAAQKFGEHATGFTIPSELDSIFDQAGPKGIGTIHVLNVYDPAVHTNGPGDVTNLDIIGGFDAAGNPSGLKVAYGMYQRFGYFCKFIHAPGFTGMTGVRAEIETIINRTKGRSFIDAPIGATRDAVLQARGPSGNFDLQFNNRRLTPCWPHMHVVDTVTGGTRLTPLSSRVLGVWLSSIVEHGYHLSPSNRPVAGIEGSEVPVTYIPGDAQSDVQLLRAAGVMTVEERYGKGPHTSGNRSSAHPTDTDIRNFMHVQLTQDMLDEAVLNFLDQYKDRLGTPARIEYLEERINSWLSSQTAAGVISGGRFSFDRTKTTADTVAQGHFHYRLNWAPVGVMERITTDRNIDLNLISDALGLAA